MTTLWCGGRNSHFTERGPVGQRPSPPPPLVRCVKGSRGYKLIRLTVR